MPYLCAMLIKRPGGFPEPNKFQMGNNPGFACYGYTIDRGTTGNIER